MGYVHFCDWCNKQLEAGPGLPKGGPKPEIFCPSCRIGIDLAEQELKLLQDRKILALSDELNVQKDQIRAKHLPARPGSQPVPLQDHHIDA